MHGKIDKPNNRRKEWMKISNEEKKTDVNKKQYMTRKKEEKFLNKMN